MELFSVMTFTATFIILAIGMYVVILNPKNSANILFLCLCLSVSVLSFTYTDLVFFRIGESTLIWYRICLFSVCFSIPLSTSYIYAFTRNKRNYGKLWKQMILYLPAVIFYYTGLSEDFAFEVILKGNIVFASLPKKEPIWFWSFFLYCITCFMQCINYIVTWYRYSKSNMAKNKVKFLVAFCVVLLFLTYSPYIMYTIVGIKSFIAPLQLLWVIFGIVFSMVKYKMAIYTPVIAADKIVSTIDIMFFVDTYGNIVKTNGKTLELLRYDLDDMLNRNIREIIDDKSIITKEKKKLEDEKLESSRIELNLLTKYNDVVPASITLSIVRDNFNDLVGYVLTGQDLRYTKKLENEIIRRKEVEIELKKSKEKYKIFFEMSTDCIYVIDIDGERIIEANPITLNKFKTSLEELSKASVYDIFTDKNGRKVKQNILKLGAGDEIRGLELEAKDTSGKQLIFEINISPIFEDGKLVKILNFARDITERKHAEELNKKVEEKNRLLSQLQYYDKVRNEFLANISHELRTPLNIQLGVLQMFDMILAKPITEERKDKLVSYSNILRQNCYRLIRIVNNLIDITKIDSGHLDIKFAKCNIVYLIEEITFSVAEYIKDRERILIFDTDIEEQIITCDPEKIERIILNLLSNAIKFTERGDTIKVNIESKKETIIISVEDTGIGIPDEIHDIIFERFIQADKSFTRRAEGSGIGLYIVKSLVEMHNGNIYLESKYGLGSKFIIELPAYHISNNEIAATYIEEESINEHIERINIEFSDIYS